jgi:sugar (pentulose or hexulose) kinase
MNTKYVIGLDLGTTTIKAGLFDYSGQLITSSSMEQNLLYPHSGYIEQDAEQWFLTSASIVRLLIEQSNIHPDEVSALSISSQAITIVPVSADHKPLYNAVSWMDNRSLPYIDQLVSHFGNENLFHMCGKEGGAAYSVAKIMWFRDHMPDKYKQTKWFLMPMDYLLMRMTGKVVSDHTMASGSMYYSLNTHDWSEKILHWSGINSNQLPVIKNAGEPAGFLTPEAASAFSLTTSCIAVVGGQDQKVAAYGLGLSKNEISLSMGTAGAFEYPVNSLMTILGKHDVEAESTDRITLCPSISPNQWVLEGYLSTLGGAIKWARDVLCKGLSYQDIDLCAAKSSIGSGGVLFHPFLAGRGTPHSKNDDRNGYFSGLTMQTKLADLIRSIYEGIGCECQLNIIAIEKYGCKVDRILAFSGAAKADELCQIISDLTGKPMVRYSYPELGILGAAKLAAKGADIDISHFGEKLLLDRFETFPQDTEKYREVFNQYIRWL